MFGIWDYLNNIEKLTASNAFPKAGTVADFSDIDHLIRALQIRAAWAVQIVATLLSVKDGK